MLSTHLFTWSRKYFTHIYFFIFRRPNPSSPLPQSFIICIYYTWIINNTHMHTELCIHLYTSGYASWLAIDLILFLSMTKITCMYIHTEQCSCMTMQHPTLNIKQQISRTTTISTSVSPDINPIEHIWSCLKLRERKTYRNSDHLFETTCELLDELTSDYIRSLTLSLHSKYG